MATSKNVANLKLSANETRTIIDAKNAVNELKRMTGKGSIDLKPGIRLIKEPVIDFINSVGFNKKQLVNCTFDADIMKMEIVSDLKGWTHEDLKKWMTDKSERIRGVEIKDRAKAELIFSEFRSLSDLFVFQEGGLSLEINPAKGIDCSYYGEGGVFYKGIKADLKIKRISYTLYCKTKKEIKWTEIASGISCGIVKVHDGREILKEGTEYTYRLIVKDLDKNETYTHITDILYEKLNVKIVMFRGYPDSIQCRVDFKYEIKNAVQSTIKVIRKDTGTIFKLEPFSDKIQSDYSVHLNEKYTYVLTAENAWGPVDHDVEIEVKCFGLEPSVGKIYFKKDDKERGGFLCWNSVCNGSVSVVERTETGLDDWVSFTPINGKYEYRDCDDSCYPLCKSLEIGKSYDYRVVYSNEWAKSYSEPITVEMINGMCVPKIPQILPPGESTLKWIVAKDVKEYIVCINGQKIRKYVACLNDEEVENYVAAKDDECLEFSNPYNMNQSYLSFFDENVRADLTYTYKIIARNCWGESVLYMNVNPSEEIMAKNDEYCYGYIAQNKNHGNYTLNFQGITTDGIWWYLTNGDNEWARENPPALYKLAVGESLNGMAGDGSGISNSFQYYCPDGGNVHIGDLDCYGDYLFAAVYKTNDSEKDEGQIWIFDKDSLERLTTVKLFRRDGTTHLYKTAWCAVNPLDGRLYTSNSYVGEKYYNPICSYEINLDAIGKLNGDIFPSKTCREFYLTDEYGNDIVKESMQGGCFDFYNNLYLNSGFDDPRESDGIHVFKLICDENEEIKNALHGVNSDSDKSRIYESYKYGSLKLPCVCTKAIMVARSNKEKNFKYQLDIRKDRNSKYDEEPQGIVYYDFDYAQKTPPQEYVNDGSFHACLLDNCATRQKESVWFKHYCHSYRKTEDLYISFDPRFLSIKRKKLKNEKGVEYFIWNLVDNGAFSKAFCAESLAENAKKILMRLNNEYSMDCVIHTIGWLKTSSNNHNYEFNIIETAGKKISDSSCLTIEYTSVEKVHRNERYEVKLTSSNGREYYFYTHNEGDAVKIIKALEGYCKLCIAGVGADMNGRIRSENNLIWLEN